MQVSSQFPKLTSDRYRIEEKLGQGGGSAVYKAWDANLQKSVVIKTLFHAAGSEQECDALKHVKSEHLPQVYDFLYEDGQAYTVMEFVEGQSLDKLLEQGRKFTQKQVIKWYGQPSSALEILHRNGVCHRDIKPANIMLQPNDNVCLIDFNAALVSGNNVQLISRSLGYCSPEQYSIYERYKRGEKLVSYAPICYSSSPEIDQNATELVNTQSTELVSSQPQIPQSQNVNSTRIDWKHSNIYSLGATMYHLLSGVRPPKDPMQLVPISKVGHFSEGLVYVIEKKHDLRSIAKVFFGKSSEECYFKHP
jgi:serine/threonine protein kinase